MPRCLRGRGSFCGKYIFILLAPLLLCAFALKNTSPSFRAELELDDRGRADGDVVEVDLEAAGFLQAELPDAGAHLEGDVRVDVITGADPGVKECGIAAEIAPAQLAVQGE